ncbi:hypothetical protein [Sphingobacterium corticibacter]|uniref:hypothetical protein n=1 Tax=Sphingobacterium corticibacter TaxID=2171749 RepID=UPI001A9C29D4|nr:hypothetical protein [Sphingobacterium corticibacter]
MEFKINKDNWEKVSLGDVVFEPKETAKDIIAEGFEHIVGLEHIESGDVHLEALFLLIRIPHLPKYLGLMMFYSDEEELI